jgi:hypothetical protein
MGLSGYSLDTFVSGGLSSLTVANAQAVGPDFPEHEKWIAGFVLRRIFLASVPQEDKAALAFALLRQAEAAVEEYDLGCAELSLLVSAKNVSRYFRCLRRFENAIGATYRVFEFGRKALKMKLFAKNDGTPLQRLNALYNDGRHGNPLALPKGQLHAVRLTNDGVFSSNTHLTFAELRDLVTQIARIADRIVKGEKDV